jgi:hypothetical protein
VAADPGALLRQLLPGTARLLLPVQNLPFGADEHGRLLVLALDGPPRGYAVWYLTNAEEPGQLRLIRLRDPEPADEFVDLQVREVFSVGDAGDKHIALLETASRAAPAGGAQQMSGSVWRRVGGSAQRLKDESRLLDDAPDAAAARAALAPLLKLPNASLLPGELPKVFLSLPVGQVDLTLRERLDRVRRDSPWLQLNDPRNGFLDIRGDAGIPGYRLALFRRDDKSELVALQRIYTREQRTAFVQREAGAWRDVSAELVPGYRADAAYVLPRRGTTVRVHGQGALHWTGARFEAR